MLTSQQFVLKNPKHSYTEVWQANPLRWLVMFQNEEGKFVQQTLPFKCKDYFNDFVAKYQGHAFKQYGMPCGSVKVNTYGMWLLLTNITDQFIGNIERAINPKLEAETGHKLNPVKVEDKPDHVLVLLPRSLFDSTYTMSYLTLIIRACNAANDFSCFEELITTSKESLVESAKWLKDLSFLPPEHLRQYWWWQGDNYSSKKIMSDNYSFNSYVHNNGVFAWVNTKGFVAATQPLTPQAVMVESTHPTHVPGSPVGLPRFVPQTVSA